MKQSTMTLPLFPLAIFLLPEGITKLRIFEPRYLKMVSIASSNQGFVICLNSNNYNTNTSTSTESESVNQSRDNMQWGSWVEIINFDQGDDGILEIDVKCKSLVELSAIEQGSDNLHFGLVREIKHWSESNIDEAEDDLSTSLANLFDENPMLSSLYEPKLLNNAHWVLARWIELLPIDLKVKNNFAVNHNYQEAKTFVESIIFKQDSNSI